MRPPLLPLALLLLACGPTEPPQPTPTPFPQECSNQDIGANFTFTFDVCWYGTLYLDADLVDLAKDLAVGGTNPVAFNLPGTLASLQQVGGETEALVAMDPPDILPDPGTCPQEQVWMMMRYRLPTTIVDPLLGQAEIQLNLLMRFVDPDAALPRIARGVLIRELLDGQAGAPLLYAEPGANGMAFALADAPNGLFNSVTQVDYACPPFRSDPCGDLLNTATRFQPLSGSTLEIWPGETGEFFLEGSAYEVTSIWSYAWQNLSCQGAGFEAQTAFVVVPSPSN